VTNILTGIAGAVLSAPAAALEAISPKAAGKTSDGVALISSKMPAVSLEDVANTTRGAAASAYNAVPEGTAATIQSYTGAAVAKAQEVLPPALGGSAVRIQVPQASPIHTYITLTRTKATLAKAN
jgi:hypothetical protein